MLNYRQLHYFWVVAKTGSIVRACEQLNLTDHQRADFACWSKPTASNCFNGSAASWN
jgi:hypothetical protein